MVDARRRAHAELLSDFRYRRRLIVHFYVSAYEIKNFFLAGSKGHTSSILYVLFSEGTRTLSNKSEDLSRQVLWEGYHFASRLDLKNSICQPPNPYYLEGAEKYSRNPPLS